MKIQLSFDDFCQENMRLAQLLLEYDFEAIFFIECNIERKIEQIKELDKMGFEIGGHSINHPFDLKQLPKEIIKYEVKGCKDKLEDKLQKKIKWFAYPRGRYNNEIKEIVKNAGYEYARTTYVNSWFNSDPYEIRTSVHVYPRKEYQELSWFRFTEKLLANIKNISDAEFHLWGHGWEIEKLDYWEQFENVLKLLKTYEDLYR